jgi:hypothetical protein
MRMLLPIVLVLSLAACDRMSAPGGEPLELRQYTVPAEKTSAIVNTLNGAMTGTEHQPGIGRASSDVEGMVVVLAPARIHDSIEKTIASLGGTDANAARGSVRMDYWVVSALPGPGTDDVSLAPVKAALDAARPALGEVHFVTFGQASLVSATQPQASASTRGSLTISQKIRPGTGGVYAQMSIQRHAPTPADENLRLDIAADVPFGQTIVLAQQDAGGDASGVRRLVLVRAEPVGGQ